MRKSLEDLKDEWEKELNGKNWYSLYQWNSLSRITYTEEISALIIENFCDINFNTNEAREREFNFRHDGKATTKAKKITEKLFCRALYNLKSIDPLGCFIDYEIPMKKTNDAKHGDIDLMSNKEDKLYIIEAKIHYSNESILKALLESYVYTMLIGERHRNKGNDVKKQFYKDFNLDCNIKLTPAILTFKTAESGGQLKEIKQYPKLKDLIRLLNGKLQCNEINNYKFFLVNNEQDDVDKCIDINRYKGKNEVIEFNDNFRPDISEVQLKL